MNNLVFEGIYNIKDLGGIKTKDGRAIKPNCLYKSAMLHLASERDIEKLKNDCGISMVIDLRTERERKAMPNPCMKGISEIWNPIYMEHIQGLEINDTVSLKKQMKQFFTMIANDRGGAILWHCTAGKDRTGIMTALVLAALGVSKETIIKTYEAAQETSDDFMEVIVSKLFPGNDAKSAKYRESAALLFGDKACYIDVFLDAIEKDYVTVENYLQKALEVRVDNIVRLKTLYLRRS